MLAEALAQRGVQQVRGGVVALGRMPRGVIDPREHGLIRVERPLLEHHRECLVVAEAKDALDARAAVALLALDRAHVGDLAPAGRVERRLGELQQVTLAGLRAVACDRFERPHRSALQLRFVPGETRLKAGLRRELACPPAGILGGVVRSCAGRRAGPRPLCVHQCLEALGVDAEAALGHQFAGEVEGEAVGVVQLEGVGRGNPLVVGVERPFDQLLQQPRALRQRAPEALLLGGQPLLDRRSLAGQFGVGAAHQLADDLCVAHEEATFHAERAALLDRAAHHAAQHVAAFLVGGDDAVGDHERHPARVVGKDPQRAVGGELLAVALPRQLLAEVDQRLELVGLEHRLLALQDRRHAVEPEAGVDVARRQPHQVVVGILVVLHEDEVPELQEALVLAAGQVVLLAEAQAAVEVQLRAGAARPDRTRFPEVLRAGTADDPLARHPNRLPQLDRLLVGAESELLIALEHRHPDVLCAEAEDLARELPRKLDRPLLEVCADREVPQHLEARQMPQRRANLLDVGRAEALLAAGEPRRGRYFTPQEVGLQRLHPGRGEQHRAILGRRQERGRGQSPVPALLEEGQVALADFVRGHSRMILESGGYGSRARRPGSVLR